jgi:cholesterol transport system auxiliary component
MINTDAPPISRRSLFIAMSAMFILAGCSDLIGPSSEPSQIYRITPVFPSTSPGQPADWQLSISRPEASQSLRTDRIALQRNGTLDYYANAQWTDNSPQLVQSLLVEAFEKSGKIRAVGKDAEGLNANLILQSELRNFEAVYDSPDSAPHAVIDIEIKLIRPAAREVVASREFHQEVPATANTVAAANLAFNAASAALLQSIVDWTVEQGDAPGAKLHHR